MRDPLERFAEKVDFSGDCWEWTAVRHRKGYGQFRAGGTMKQAHRWLYEQVVELVPEGLELDHLCRNRGCVNPDHLEPVTHQENVARRVSNAPALRKTLARKRAGVTKCPRGHRWTPENTRPRKENGGRMCVACNIENGQRYRARQKNYSEFAD